MLGSPWTTNLAMILIMITIAVIIEHQDVSRHSNRLRNPNPRYFGDDYVNAILTMRKGI